MNTMPGDWTQQLREVYPKRSGPCGWGGMRLLLKVRAAMFDVTWDELLQKVQEYARYCQDSGKTGSDFVKTPGSYLDDKIYLEDLCFQVPEDPKVTEAKRKEAERWAKAREAGERISPPIRPFEHESVGAFETRISLARNDRECVRIVPTVPTGPTTQRMVGLGRSVAQITERMRIAK